MYRDSNSRNVTRNAPVPDGGDSGSIPVQQHLDISSTSVFPCHYHSTNTPFPLIHLQLTLSYSGCDDDVQIRTAIFWAIRQRVALIY